MESTSKELEELEKDIFYHMLKRADELDQDEKPIKFNYLNIVSKLKPGIEARIINEGIEYLNKKTEEMIYPFGDQHTHICRYHPDNIEIYDENETSEHYFYKEALPPQRSINSQHFIKSKACKKIKGAVRLDREARNHIHSLFDLDKLEDYIKRIIEEIKKSELRNYVGAHSTEIFQDDVIFKIYRGQEQIDRLKTESLALEYFQKELPQLHVPKVFCHGRLGDFYVLLEEKIRGVTADRFLRYNQDSQQKEALLDRLLNETVQIGVEGYANNLPALYGKLTEEKLSEWLKEGIMRRLAIPEDLIRRINENYGEIKQLLLNSPFLYNKDIPTRNWLIGDNGVVYSIDFENTHLGPVQLDLVTLFEGKDGFELDDHELIPTLKRICGKINSYITRNKKDLPSFKETDFLKTYLAASVHRNLSMAGTNKERSDKKQITRHLEKAKYSLDKLCGIIDDKYGKMSLQTLGDIIHKIKLNSLQ